MPRPRKQRKAVQPRGNSTPDKHVTSIWNGKCPHTSTWMVEKWASLIPLLESVTKVPHSGPEPSRGSNGSIHGLNELHGIVCVECGLGGSTPKMVGGKHKKVSHSICFDKNTRQLYCLKCDDYVYIEEFEALVLAVKRKNEKWPVCFDEGSEPASQYEPYQDDSKSRSAVSGDDGYCHSNQTNQFVSVNIEDEFPVGLRGMNNMGNTCFMNSILQAFLRTPLLPKYYLSCNHFEGNCRVSGEGGHCVECQLDTVISDVYSGIRTAYSPVNFLHTWWMMAGGFLSGYKQQDAHEFFLFILQMLTGHPNDIATSLFIGQMHSHIFCPGCGRNSVQKDEFSHMSLDVTAPSNLLPPPIAPRVKPRTGSKGSRGKKGSKKKQKSVSNDLETSQVSMSQSMQTTVAMGKDEEQDTLSSPGRRDVSDPTPSAGKRKKPASWNHPALAGYLRWPGDSLLGCLRRFTCPEVLDGVSHSWKCPECNEGSGAIKQISIMKLPPIMAMHFKRFEYTGGVQSRPRKIETFVSFPLDNLDMSSFLTSRIHLQRQGVRCMGASKEFLYDAFAVVCHRGTFEGGHYVSYVRCENNKWYLCDDAFVTQVPDEVVRNCQAYMVFYSKKNISPWST
jgi:ubiquitin C-terminal hydrolase